MGSRFILHIIYLGVTYKFYFHHGYDFTSCPLLLYIELSKLIRNDSKLTQLKRSFSQCIIYDEDEAKEYLSEEEIEFLSEYSYSAEGKDNFLSELCSRRVLFTSSCEDGSNIILNFDTEMLSFPDFYINCDTFIELLTKVYSNGNLITITDKIVDYLKSDYAYDYDYETVILPGEDWDIQFELEFTFEEMKFEKSISFHTNENLSKYIRDLKLEKETENNTYYLTPEELVSKYDEIFHRQRQHIPSFPPPSFPPPSFPQQQTPSFPQQQAPPFFQQRNPSFSQQQYRSQFNSSSFSNF